MSVSDDLAARGGRQRSVEVQADRIADKPDRAVSECKVDATSGLVLWLVLWGEVEPGGGDP